MAKALLDTDTLSEVIKGRDAVVAERARAYLEEQQRFTISAITVFEVVQGFQRVQRDAALRRFTSSLPAMEVLAVDSEIAVLAGQIYGDLARTGQPIGRIDPLIAATALAANLTLVTGNVRHYERIAALGHQLRIENWRQG